MKNFKFTTKVGVEIVVLKIGIYQHSSVTKLKFIL